MTNELTVEEGNTEIAIFMGAELTAPMGHMMRAVKFPQETHGLWLHAKSDLRYHSSWDWLMPVVEKISIIEFDRDEQELPMGGVEVLIHTYYPRTFGMLNNESRKPMFRYNANHLFEADTLIEAAWLATVDFIQWYNSKLLTNGH